MIPVEPLGLPPVVCLHIPNYCLKQGNREENKQKQKNKVEQRSLVNDEGSNDICFYKALGFLKKIVKKHIGTLLQS